MRSIDDAVADLVTEMIENHDFTEVVESAVKEIDLTDTIEEELSKFDLSDHEVISDLQRQHDDLESRISELENCSSEVDFSSICDEIRGLGWGGNLCRDGMAIVRMVQQIVQRNDTLEILLEHLGPKPTITEDGERDPHVVITSTTVFGPFDDRVSAFAFIGQHPVLNPDARVLPFLAPGRIA